MDMFWFAMLVLGVIMVPIDFIAIAIATERSAKWANVATFFTFVLLAMASLSLFVQ